ncbi:MAG: hypothetical protein A2087_10560 [Spirochaetes bacterium GWD1_61_31]|nr:MAG: hypothetical protein A2Y37_11955 [Spirochaetes bacterium GWB1_60_80]OHD30096.1 MAG: hypothetical protein A2004_13815 [Spirochaetes bacterium GWC1_61_12]OHD34653.1 MAG: hypothetical protein A2087_10560 [Spirochaetes bacterium GWD1_61_31]OHD46469.1 MAG: hypothetical protein A2Y35_10465 [Spirochaetes bacterium GWE1_60_18]OHD59524.1 MAG: hypothetical protein A2Y32_10420 [Spirochaetes bacterium GWF1_60_12]HAW85778.1 glutaredoxin family protein [Spirochaetaceae bacterium]
MRETLSFIRVTGKRNDTTIEVYSLSTCGFCKRAIAFLDAKGYSYSYVHLDTLPLDQKTTVKRELHETFGKAVAFPYAIFNHTDALVGFVEAEWLAKLGLQ